MKKCALIVDDSQLGRLMLHTYISQLDEQWQVILANDGHDALLKTSNIPIDVMFIDFNMPGMNGLELIEKLRENGVSAPSALVTANIQSAVRERAAKLNVSFVGKPVTKQKVSDFLTQTGL